MINTKDWKYLESPGLCDTDSDTEEKWFWMWDSSNYEKYLEAVKEKHLRTLFGDVELDYEVIGIQKNHDKCISKSCAILEIHNWYWIGDKLSLDVKWDENNNLICHATRFWLKKQ